MAAEHAPAPTAAEDPASASACLPLGLLGGTFDPIHLGHLRLAEEAREALGLGSLRLIPAGRPPHRGEPGSTAENRLAMAHLAADNLIAFFDGRRPLTPVNRPRSE